MILMDEMIPMRLYSSKQRAYLPFNATNKRKGSLVTLLTQDLQDSISLMNTPFFNNPSYYTCYYQDRNVKRYLSNDGNIVIEGEDEDPDIIEEAVLRKTTKNGPTIISYGNMNDRRLLDRYFTKKLFDKWYDYFKVRNGNRIYPYVYGFNSLKDMFNAVGQTALEKHGTLIANSYNSATEIVLLNNSEYSIHSSDGPYQMYCEAAIITYVIHVGFPKATWKLANNMATHLSGQDQWLYQRNDFKSDDKIGMALLIGKYHADNGREGMIKLARSGDYYLLVQYGAKNFIDRIAKSAMKETMDMQLIGVPNLCAITELAEIADNKIVIGTDYHFIGYNDERTKIIIKSDTYVNRIIEKQNKLVGRDGIFIYLGDLFYKSFRTEYDIPGEMKDKGIEMAKRLKGKYKILVRGNHDNLPDDFYIEKCGFTHVCSGLQYRNYIFSHQPEIVIDPNINIHGHMHGSRAYVEGKPKNHFDVYTLGNHTGTLTDVLNKQKEYDASSAQAKNINKADPYHHIPGKKMDLEEILDESTILEFSIDPSIKTDADLSRWMKSNIKYKTMTNLMSPEELYNSKHGCCHDQVLFEKEILKYLGYNPSAWLVFEYSEKTGQSGETHSYITYKKNGKLYWFENAWTPKAGIHEIKETDFIKDMHNSGRWGNKSRYPSLEITRFIGNEGDSLQELIDRSTITESTILESDGMHADVVRIFKAMSDKDQKFITTDQRFQNWGLGGNDNCIYRHIERENLLGLNGFIECYSDLHNSASIVIGVDPKHRGQGIATKMMEQMLKEFPKENPNIDALIWRADAKNLKSQKLAEKFGFKLIRKSSIQNVYRKWLKNENKDFDLIDSSVIDEVSLVKWIRKRFEIDSTMTDRTTKLRSLKDIVHSTKITNLECGIIIYTALKKMGLDTSIILFGEHNGREDTLGDVYPMVLHTYGGWDRDILCIDPFNKNLKTGIANLKKADQYFEYGEMLHNNGRWGVVSERPYVFSYVPYDEELKGGNYVYKDIIKPKNFTESALLEFSTKNKISPPEFTNSKLPMSLNRLKKIKIDDKVIKTYSPYMSGLHHLRTTNNCTGYLWVDPNKHLNSANLNAPVCYYNVQSKKDDNSDTGEVIWIQGIEVSEEYQGRGLAKQLLDICINQEHATNLAVDKDNEVAIRLYRSKGFVPYVTNGKMINMQRPIKHESIFISPNQKGVMMVENQMFVFTEELSQTTYNSKLRQYLYKDRIRTSSQQLDIFNQVKASVPMIRRAYVKPQMYRQLNTFIDLSYYNGLFLKHNKYARDIAIKFYWEYLNRMLNGTDEYFRNNYSKNTIFVPVWTGSWPVADGTYIYDWKENLNPISLIFRMIRKNPAELLNKWSKFNFIFIGRTGYFRIDFGKFALKNLTKFKRNLEKLYANEPIENDEDENGYGSTSMDSTQVHDTSSSAAITAQVIDKIEVSSGVQIDDISAAITKNNSKQNTSQITGLKVSGDSDTIPDMVIKNNPIITPNTNLGIAILSPSEEKIIATIKDNKDLFKSQNMMMHFYSK